VTIVKRPFYSDGVAAVTRRELMLGVAATGVLAAAPGRAATPAATRLLTVRRSIDVNGKAASALALVTSDSKLARFNRGGRFAVTLENHLDEPTLVHWHGLTPPSAQDGMPELSQPLLAAGKSYDYDFPLTRAGTFWMHSHSGFQRAKLLAAPLIVADPRDAQRDEQEVVILLADFAFRQPEEIFAGLTGGTGGAMHDMAGMDHADTDHGAMSGMDQSTMDHGAMSHDGMHHGGMAGDMPMGMDLNDIDFDAYLANDRTLADPRVVRVEPAAKVRLRIINGASATNFWIDLGALSGELIAVDGDPVVTIKAKRFPLAMAQRIDVRVAVPRGQGAYPILALREGAVERTGIVLATKQARVAKLSLQGTAATKPLGLALEAQLTSARPLARRQVDRGLDVDLTGDMMRFVWGINGKRYGEDAPLKIRAGERVEIALRNRTTMAHPMHLHGHHFQVVGINDRRLSGAVRDTVLVPAMGNVTIAFDADNPGKWAFHCHNEYHMIAGMMTSVQYEA
jgi:FtsP/CotA-like multicopper oxidase with cupredoxin domain